MDKLNESLDALRASNEPFSWLNISPDPIEWHAAWQQEGPAIAFELVKEAKRWSEGYEACLKALPRLSYVVITTSKL